MTLIHKRYLLENLLKFLVRVSTALHEIFDYACVNNYVYAINSAQANCLNEIVK